MNKEYENALRFLNKGSKDILSSLESFASFLEVAAFNFNSNWKFQATVWKQNPNCIGAMPEAKLGNWNLKAKKGATKIFVPRANGNVNVFYDINDVEGKQEVLDDLYPFKYTDELEKYIKSKGFSFDYWKPYLDRVPNGVTKEHIDTFENVLYACVQYRLTGEPVIVNINNIDLEYIRNNKKDFLALFSEANKEILSSIRNYNEEYKSYKKSVNYTFDNENITHYNDREIYNKEESINGQKGLEHNTDDNSGRVRMGNDVVLLDGYREVLRETGGDRLLDTTRGDKEGRIDESNVQIPLQMVGRKSTGISPGINAEGRAEQASVRERGGVREEEIRTDRLEGLGNEKEVWTSSKHGHSSIRSTNAERTRGSSSTGNRGNSLQLNLFDEQGVEADVSAPSSFEQVNNSISDDVFKAALTMGFDSSVVAPASIVRRNRTDDETAEIFKKAFSNDGFGFTYKGIKYSVWYDETGYFIDFGKTARKNTAKRYEWIDVVKSVRELYSQGLYSRTQETEDILSYDKLTISRNIVRFYIDVNNQYKNDNGLFSVLNEPFEKIYSYPDREKYIATKLEERAFVDELMKDVEKIISDKNAGVKTGLLNYNYLSSLDFTFQSLKAFSLETIDRADAGFEKTIYDKFISDDVLDEYLIQHGTGFINGKNRVFEFFNSTSTLRDRSEFLKKEFGIGGSGSGVISASYDAKGLELSQGKFSLYKASAAFSWSEIARRIDKLIKEKRYIVPKDIEAINDELSEEKLENMGDLLNALKIDDIAFGFNDDGTFFAKADDDYEWTAKGFYSFLLNDCLSFDANGNLSDGFNIDNSVLQAIIDDAKAYGVEPKLPKPKYTPLWQQYLNIKSDYPNYLLFIQVGDFYEAFDNDAKSIAKDLDLVLTARTINHETNERIAMAGFPSYRLDDYTSKLLKFGYKIAVVQMENGKTMPVSVIERKNAIDNNSIEARLVNYLKNTDYYDYQDNLEIGQTDEDAISIIGEQLKNKFFIDGVISYMTDHIAEEAINVHEAEMTGGDTKGSLELLHNHQKLLDELNDYANKLEPTQENDDDLIGKEVVIDDNRFIIDSVNNGYVSMTDLDFAENVGFPISRKETVDFVKSKMLMVTRLESNESSEKSVVEQYNRINDDMSILLYEFGDHYSIIGKNATSEIADVLHAKLETVNVDGVDVSIINVKDDALEGAVEALRRSNFAVTAYGTNNLTGEMKKVYFANYEDAKKNSAWIELVYSESPAFYCEALKNQKEFSFAFMDKLMGYLDMKQHRDRLYPQPTGVHLGWYDKTKFILHYDVDGEKGDLQDRYDLGDGFGGLYNFIQGISNGYIEYADKLDGEKTISKYTKFNEVVMPYLKELVDKGLTQKEQELYDDVMIEALHWNNGIERRAEEIVALGFDLGFDEIVAKLNTREGAYEILNMLQDNSSVPGTDDEIRYIKYLIEEIEEELKTYKGLRIADLYSQLDTQSEDIKVLGGNKLEEAFIDGNYQLTISDKVMIKQKNYDLYQLFYNGEYERGSSNLLLLLLSANELYLNELRMGAKELAETHIHSIINTTMRDSVVYSLPEIETTAHIVEEDNEEIIENDKENIVKEKESRENNPADFFADNTTESNENYIINPEEMVFGTPSQRINDNIEALTTLRKAQSCGVEQLTMSDKKLLSRYVGWGGLADVFKPTNSNYETIKGLLSSDEYSSARSSTLTAFYTPPVVVEAIYKALQNFGFKGGKVLEPSCGVGNFMGMLPEALRNSVKFSAVELDNISAEITKYLYPNAKVINDGFEHCSFEDDTFDVAIGNVPFGQYKLNDKKYDKYNFLIHDYFFAKTLDKVKPNGVIAFITSSGTMDKQSSAVRDYIAERADLIGAIRLAETTFKANAGTTVTSDIIFLQKRENGAERAGERWSKLSLDNNDIELNEYFVNHPEMICGTMEMHSTAYGMQSYCKENDNISLEEQLNSAIKNLNAIIPETILIEEHREDKADDYIEYDVDIHGNCRDFSYIEYDGQIYFRKGLKLEKTDFNDKQNKKLRSFISIRDTMRNLANLEINDAPDVEVESERTKLNQLVNEFHSKYGYLQSKGAKSLFNADDGYTLVKSLELFDENHNYVRGADILSKRTIRPWSNIKSFADTPNEALNISLSERGCVDIEYMSSLLSGMSEEEIYTSLNGVIFLEPTVDREKPNHYLMADEYLSGNVREKLNFVRMVKEIRKDIDYSVNESALIKVQPKDLDATEISVRLGQPWIPASDIEDFMKNQLKLNVDWHRVSYNEYLGDWTVKDRTYGYGVNETKVYGTNRKNAFELIECILNQKMIEVKDSVVENGKTKYVPNVKETEIARAKGETIKREFQNWIWQDPDRRQRLVKDYNVRYNSNVPREFNGDHLIFPGMTNKVMLKGHQKNAVARIMYGGNTLLAHCVGAGKTFTMAAAGMEQKRIGLINKPMFVVPNHLIGDGGQWAEEFMRLYPTANILVANKSDFEKANRQLFLAKVQTGDYDAIIISQSMFERIPMSQEYQEQYIQSQIDELENLANSVTDSLTVKQLEAAKKRMANKLEKLSDRTYKDEFLTFEELGVDRIFVDESHYYKNLYSPTKMTNVAGVAQTEAKKSNDLFMKCRYLDQKTNRRGIVFATGTPISNSVVELYTLEKYLAYDKLIQDGFVNFDVWASQFGETKTSMELSPEGKGYRAKTRFSKFFNLPELIDRFKEFADVRTSDTLDLDVPEANRIVVEIEPTDTQKLLVDSFAKRAEKIRGGGVDPTEDNMLKITHDGRMAALDQRLYDESLPDVENNKTSTCCKNVVDIYNKYDSDKATQLVFCDVSTPSKEFNIYDDLKQKLIGNGIPEEEIAFIHDYGTESKRKTLFEKVNSGAIRVLIGSTQKMGAGTNVQQRLKAVHHIDCPWRPSDLEQRNGRVIRQGNMFKEVDVFTYVVKGTFDAYLYQMVENKQKFISQIMTSKTPVRDADDVDEAVLNFQQIKAIASGNPLIVEKLELENQIRTLKHLKQDFDRNKFQMQDDIVNRYPKYIRQKQDKIIAMQNDEEYVSTLDLSKDAFEITINGTTYKNVEEGCMALVEAANEHIRTNIDKVSSIGNYKGFEIKLSYNAFTRKSIMSLSRGVSYDEVVNRNSSIVNFDRLNDCLCGIGKVLSLEKGFLDELEADFEKAKIESQKDFPDQEELDCLEKRLAEVDAELILDDKEKDKEASNEVSR